MRAYQLPYPPPRETLEMAEILGQMEMLKRKVDFPERRVSYVIECSDEEFERCALEVRKAVALCEPGQEPPRLEIRIGD